MANAWFRFYSESLRDRKLERISRVTGQPKALLLGVWVTLLSLANDSPIPGALLLTEDIPLELDDLCLETDLDHDTLAPIIDRFIALQMLSQEEGVYIVTNWDKRQFKSDSSRERVRRHRARHATDDPSDSNDDVTLQGSCGNAPEQNRTDTEQNKGANAPRSFDDWLQALRSPQSMGATNGIGVLVLMGQSLYEHFPPSEKSTFSRVGALAKAAGSQSKFARVMWDNASKPLSVPLDYLTTVVSEEKKKRGPDRPKQKFVTVGGES